MEEEKALTTRNKPEKKQQKRCRCGSIKHLRVTSKDFPTGLAIRKDKKLALGMGLSKSKENKAVEDASEGKYSKCLVAEAAGEGQKLDEGESAVNTE